MLPTTPATEPSDIICRPIALRSTKNNVVNNKTSLFAEVSLGHEGHVQKFSGLIQDQLKRFNLQVGKEEADYITRLALRLLPGSFAKVKTGQRSIYMAAEDADVLVYIPLKIQIAKQPYGVITKCAGLCFKNLRDISKAELHVKLKTKHIAYLAGEPVLCVDVYKASKAANRALNMDLLQKCRNVATADVWGRIIGKKGLKQIIFQDCFDSDFFDLIKTSYTSLKSNHNKYRFALDIARALYDMHGHYDKNSTGIVHRDLKFENLLVSMEKSAVSDDVFINQVLVTDFDLSCARTNKEKLREKSGTVCHLAPEMLGLFYDWKPLLALFGVKSYLSLISSKIDTWTFGQLLYYLQGYEHELKCFSLLNEIHDNLDSINRLILMIDETKKDQERHEDNIFQKETLLQHTDKEMKRYQDGEKSEACEGLQRDKKEIEEVLRNLYTEGIQIEEYLKNLNADIAELQLKNHELLTAFYKEIESMHAQDKPPDDWPTDPLAELIWQMLRPDPRQRPSDAIVLAIIEECALRMGVL